jgi:hypothetical protein
MKSVIRRSLMSRRRSSENPLHLFPNSRIVVTMSGLLLGSLVASLTMAEVTPLTKEPISREAMAMHVQAKRSVAKTTTTLEPAAKAT